MVIGLRDKCCLRDLVRCDCCRFATTASSTSRWKLLNPTLKTTVCSSQTVIIIISSSSSSRHHSSTYTRHCRCLPWNRQHRPSQVLRTSSSSARSARCGAATSTRQLAVWAPAARRFQTVRVVRMYRTVTTDIISNGTMTEYSNDFHV